MKDGSEVASRVVIVTGASSGIGRATARAFAAAGDRVLAVGRRQGELVETAREDASIHPYVADLRDPAQPARTVAAAIERWGRLDVLVNNAGIFALMPVDDITIGRMQELFAINVAAPSLLVREAAPWLGATGGAVVNVSSTLGRVPAPDTSHYGASKAALEHLTRSWAVELAPRGIRVNGVAPGPTESGALAAAGLTEQAIDAVKADETAAIPLGRRGTPEEVARWIVRFAGARGDWVTGQIVGIDGGLEVA